MKKKTTSRRVFLKGAMGVTMALPFLDAFGGKQALAAGNDEIAPRFFVCVRGGNGVRQEAGSEPEKFWPMDTGPLTPQMLTQTDGDGDIRAVGELADFSEKLLLVSGTKYNYPGNGCGHSGGGNQCLTATPPSDTPEGNRSLATGESIDNMIQRLLCPDDPEPLTLASGRSSSYLDEVLSYREPPAGETNAILRSAERSPWEIYKSIFGQPDEMSSDLLEQEIAMRRKSVNDLLREQLTALRSNPALSRQDLIRLELHQDSIRDLEVRMMECHLPQQRWAEFEDADENDLHTDPVNTETITKMMMDVVALAFACDLKRAATLQIGNGNDQTVYSIDGPEYPFHWISHRIQGDGASGSAPPIDDAADLHYQIDRVHMRWFKYLLEQLDQYTTATGTLLDDTVAIWTNDLANGVGHSYRNLPYVIAGSGGGYLRTGVHIDARDSGGNAAGDGWVPHNQVFNTVLNAVGVGEAMGAPVTDFGHKGGDGHEQPNGGEIDGMKA
jgi:hypothetical protein